MAHPPKFIITVIIIIGYFPSPRFFCHFPKLQIILRLWFPLTGSESTENSAGLCVDQRTLRKSLLISLTSTELRLSLPHPFLGFLIPRTISEATFQKLSSSSEAISSSAWVSSWLNEAYFQKVKPVTNSLTLSWLSVPLGETSSVFCYFTEQDLSEGLPLLTFEGFG